MAPKKQKDKWRKAFDKRERNLEDLEDSKASREPSEQNQEATETPSPGTEGSQGACGTSTDEKPGGKRKGRFAKMQMEAKMHGRHQGRKETGPGDDFNKPKQARKGCGAPVSSRNGEETSLNGRGKPFDNRNQDQRPGRPQSTNKPSSMYQNTRPSSSRVSPRTRNSLDLKTLKEKGVTEVVHELNESTAQLIFFLRSQEEQHNSEEFIFDLTYTLASACGAPPGEKANKILATLKGSVFWREKIPRLLNRIRESKAMNDHDSRQTLFQSLITVFTRYLAHLPSAYGDPPYDELKQALDQSSVDRKEELQKELDAFKQVRDDIIRRERQKHGSRYISRVGENPPNDFRDIPIFPTDKEITTQERPFLRKNITKGRYENAEHYLDVQFRLLREDFLEPLREGIHEIVQNVPRQQRQQLMKNYRSVRIVGMKCTQSGIIHQVQIDVSRLDTSRWAHAKRFMYGSFVCLSEDNFKTMLFATVGEQNSGELKKGRIYIRFVEEQDVLGIESRKCVYQMVESPAYFEAYRHVLKGLKELNERTLPFKKYLVYCSEDVDPPEYLRRDDTRRPVCYNLREALHVRGPSSTVAVPVLNASAWPPVEAFPLNFSQFDALRTAITTEFSVIQGPPGTGKTYVGTKIVKCLLANRTAWNSKHNSPMLMVCYTNHALDQFLEKVLEFDFLPSGSVIRVGGRSKSEKLEDCNLKKFTSISRLQHKRNEVEQRMRQNGWEIRMWKEHLAKADRQLLMFDDLEDLLNSAHADQLWNALFPSHIANESRTPDNTFKLWLCDDKLVGSYNQSTVGKSDKSELSPDGSVIRKIFVNENSDVEVFYDATLTRSSNDADEMNTNTTRTQDLSPGIKDSNDTNRSCPEQKVDSVDSEQPRSLLAQERNSSLEIPSSSNASRASLNKDRKVDSSGLIEVADSVNVTERLYNVEQEPIAIEREEDLVQDQRCIDVEEDLLQEIPQREDEVDIQDHDKALTNEENDGWTPVIHKRKGNPFFWKRERDETKSTKQRTKKKKKKNAKKNRNSKITITGDITTLGEALKKHEMMTTDEVMAVHNIWDLSHSDRLRLYLFWIENYRDRYRVEIHRSEQGYNQLCEERVAITFEEEEQVIRGAAVVGMTTSAAAKYHSMLQRVAPKIVVIEEAAEVMEAHIITSLTHNTKHTILIGDHKQLRPKATVFELAQKYNLGVSLFERMIMNNMECKRLSIQHRMRPEIATLTKRIYDHEILDHESVCCFEDIRGVGHNVFFISHSQPENLIGGLQSYSNHHEAQFLVAFCNYLLLQGYQRSQITVLTMYTGQLLLLQEMMPKRNFEGVRVCAVDNFQGEENDIILLSLVRSNLKRRIGFLGESNRICVALSRARQGFYCIGNFGLLKSQSDVWKTICDDLQTKEAIGESLQLVCKRHSNVTRIRWPSDFTHSTLGGCAVLCEERLDCGHACEKPCHALDRYHGQGYCSKPCPNFCPSNHKCYLQCHYPKECPKCYVLVLKTIPRCGHEKHVRCSIDPSKEWCGLKCKKTLKCGHNCQEPCGRPCTERCVVSCNKTLGCGHEKTMLCYKDPIENKHCNRECTKVLECGHPCSKRCTDPCRCDSVIEVQLACKHRKQVICREKDVPVKCDEKCKRLLECGHDCPGICHEDCKMRQCVIDVVKDLPCGHQQSVPCYQDPQTALCLAPCPRKLDCGHKCSSVCGCLCQQVQCTEMCVLKCARGHSCQTRCHFGLPCDDCMVEVDVEIPACGHSLKVPCFVDPAKLKCKQPCEKERGCGHRCTDICGKKCDARMCKVRVPRTLPCGHVVTLECQKNAEKVVCKELLLVHLSCGHQTSLQCHVAKAGLGNVQCKKLVEKELICKHKITLPCFKSPGHCICRKKVKAKLPCGHTKVLSCFNVTKGLSDAYCAVRVQRILPCGHEATLQCHTNVEHYCCDEEVETTLNCGHIKVTPCANLRDELQVVICDKKVTRELACGHQKEMLCSMKPDDVCCDAPCESLLSCGHPCYNICGNECVNVKCSVRVQKDLSCGYHKVSCPCYQDVSQFICSHQCKRQLKCDHLCPGKCFEDCSQYSCQKLVMKNLNCAGNHSKKMPCSEDPKSVACLEPCNSTLGCEHPCPGLCSQLCESMKCRRRAEKKFPCGHKENLQCFQLKTAICKAPCQRRKECKHICKGVCGELCSNVPCDVAMVKTLSCDHKVRMPCCVSADNAKCPAPCGAKLPCGHQCSGVCNDCRQKGSHEICQHPCSRILVCSHRCQAICGMPCPPCNRKCGRRCPHVNCTKRCSHSCYACHRPCTWNCPHYQCNNLCGEECDRPPCDEPCPEMLACRHRCIGLCGENCPTVCLRCPPKKLSSVVGGVGLTLKEGTRYLQLFDCGHILTVEEMDAWMFRELGDDVQLIQCPKCSTAITFSFRYGNQIKRTLKNMEDVKQSIRKLVKETSNLASHLLRGLHPPSQGIFTMVEKLSWHRNSMALDNVSPQCVPLIFTLKNHFIIMRQIEKAQQSLQNVRMVSAGSKQHSETIKDALERITDYLVKPQPDLITLDQVYEHTRKFSLFALILEAQSEAIVHHKSFSEVAENSLKEASNKLNLFLEGNNVALHIDWLERTVTLLRKEIGLPPSPSEEQRAFENFPGFSKGVWKLCEHLEVFFTRSIVRNGGCTDVASKGCSQCADMHEEQR